MSNDFNLESVDTLTHPGMQHKQ